MTLLLVIVMSLFIVWAAYFEIDQNVRSTGSIIPSGRTQIIQVADGGVLERLLVEEGDHVTSGQVLAILKKERASAARDEGQAKFAALKIALIRATAESKQMAPKFTDEFKLFPEFIAAEMDLYKQRKKTMTDEVESLSSQITLAIEELNMHQELMKTGDSSRLEVMRAQRQVNDLQGKINQAKNKYLEGAREQVTKLSSELEAARFQLKEKQDVLEHTEIIAPVAGIIKYQKLNTMGGVLRPGDEIMQLSPTDGQMIVELKLNPVDVGSLELDLPAKISFDAFDSSIYGTVEGRLDYISSDTLTEQGPDGGSITYYSAQVVINEDFRDENQKFQDVVIKPGMTASVNIKTDRRTVLHYLIKPINRAFDGALSER
jgi:adhesin transport system membrane fusion protein